MDVPKINKDLEKELIQYEKLFEEKKYSFHYRNPGKYWGPISVKEKTKFFMFF